MLIEQTLEAVLAEGSAVYNPPDSIDTVLELDKQARAVAVAGINRMKVIGSQVRIPSKQQVVR
jgi:hypothetical protein